MPWILLPNGTYQRPLGDSEYALFSASHSGNGDMFLHLSLRASANCFSRERVGIAWALIRRENPLLMSRVTIVNDEPTLYFAPPRELIQDAQATLMFNHKSKEELITAYMDGARPLSNDILSLLTISESATGEYQIFMCAPHFCGDGTTLHVSTHELIRLVTSSQTNEQLMQKLHQPVEWIEVLPPSLEERLRIPGSQFAQAACKINYLQALNKEFASHVLPRLQRAEKCTGFIEREFSLEKTASILAKCKAHGVTVNHVLTALATIAWARCTSQPFDLPMMLYTAASLRGHLIPHHPTTSDTFLALAYFTISLPAFPPSGTTGVWHRARLAKKQMQNAVRSPLLPARAVLSAASRARRITNPPPTSLPTLSLPGRPEHSKALMGISLIGDLDRTYRRHEYGPDVQLLSVGTASRLKPGGFLLLGHSFGKKLVLQLCWDKMGFVDGEIERFWTQVASEVDEISS
ncbi:hypothetical protein MIND_00439400 [Mycena indigotica]|uniref:Condensation domain-containing protein n=1 Tax=Mycena indigotica TaxID=2126181 RepID=A0A8H6W842_9AGAR|nr:uncharacterized protein MIND_00439400 [Mycena indigotica]KAF7306481.1 hypothetical protein MIND_00439400 [Mycena indigotica]